MSQAEGNSDLLLIGKLIVEQGSLEKRIGGLCDELARRASVFAKVANLLIAKPECLVFKGEAVAEEFSGEHAIDRDAMAIDSLLEDLRAAIVEKSECAATVGDGAVGFGLVIGVLERTLFFFFISGVAMAIVRVGKVAQALNLTPQRVQQLANEGLPKEDRGKYDLGKCMLWYIRYLQAALEKKAVPMADGGYVGEREERVRLLRAEADLKEIELAKERGQLVAIQDVEKEMTDLVLTSKARIMAIPPRVAPELVGESSRMIIQTKLEKACKEALALLAREGEG